MAYIAFGIITIWWGSRNASDSILNEINDHTWDWQQMSAQSPWRMTIGKIFGSTITNSDGKIVYVRYIGEQHVREDCNNTVPSAKDWIDAFHNPNRPIWMMKTMKIELED
jgi:hypothetical protein